MCDIKQNVTVSIAAWWSVDDLLFCVRYVFIWSILWHFPSCKFSENIYLLLLYQFQSHNLTGNVLYTSPSKIKAIYLPNTQFIYHSIFLSSLSIFIHHQSSIRLSIRPDPSLLQYFKFSLSFLPLLLLHYFPLSKVAFFSLLLYFISFNSSWRLFSSLLFHSSECNFFPVCLPHPWTLWDALVHTTHTSRLSMSSSAA